MCTLACLFVCFFFTYLIVFPIFTYLLIRISSLLLEPRANWKLRDRIGFGILSIIPVINIMTTCCLFIILFRDYRDINYKRVQEEVIRLMDKEVIL